MPLSINQHFLGGKLKFGHVNKIHAKKFTHLVIKQANQFIRGLGSECVLGGCGDRIVCITLKRNLIQFQYLNYWKCLSWQRPQWSWHPMYLFGRNADAHVGGQARTSTFGSRPCWLLWIMAFTGRRILLWPLCHYVEFESWVRNVSCFYPMYLRTWIHCTLPSLVWGLLRVWVSLTIQLAMRTLKKHL